jgi:hypothetical protein
MNTLPDFSNAKIGDRVWSPQHAWGKVTDVLTNPIGVTVDFFKVQRKYDMEGMEHHENAVNPSLFWNEFEVPQSAYVKKVPHLEVDTPVIVWDFFERYNRYFSHFDEDGYIHTFPGGATSWSFQRDIRNCHVWKNWELPL